MRIKLTIPTILTICMLAGCNGPFSKKEFLTVDFHQAQALRYKFVSSRSIKVDWDPMETVTKRGTETVRKYRESMEMNINYTPIEIDPYGLTTIKAICGPVQVKRKSLSKKRLSNDDPVTLLHKKTYTFTVDPTGKIKDYSQLDSLVKQIGGRAFRPSKKRGRIKDPDMITDFTATQWFLWDSIASIENPTKGVSIGQSWKSKLSVPTPMVSRIAREVTYTLDEIRQTEKGRIAVIKSSYSPAKSTPKSWPIPYSGQFRMSGTFGFMKSFLVLELKGQGEELFNIDQGRIEQYNQDYEVVMDASLLMPLGTSPRITIKQNLTMQLLN
ncbi:MAG: hypothetical protein KAS75_03600 [Planctomycetes bacterium]|nr:hypothetical protein [Planctomycetota bacterium]